MTADKQRHRTTAEHARVAGWVDLDDEWEVTVMPPVDVRYGVDGWPVVARPNYNDMLAICARYNAEPITSEDVDRIRDIGVPLVPYLGTPVEEVTLEHSKLHDADMARQLQELKWDGKRVLMNYCKWWVAGAPAKRSKLKGWYLYPHFSKEILDKFRGIPDQGQGGKSRSVDPGEYIQPLMIAHNRFHHGDGTSMMMKRRKGAKGPGDDDDPVELAFVADNTGSAGGRRDLNGDIPPRVTSRGDKGPAVKAFQTYLQSYFAKLGLVDPLATFGADGDHGTETENARLSWLDLEGLGELPDDWPGPQSGPPIPEEPPPDSDVEPVPDTEPAPAAVAFKLWDPRLGRVPEGRIPFKQAKHYYPGRRRPVRLLLVHTPEMNEDLKGVDSNAEALMNYAHNMPDGRVASWNYASDRDSVTQSVRMTDTAFHGGKGANAHTAGVEISMGFARQTPQEWADDYSMDAMELAAELFAILCRENGIPPERPHHSTIRDESVRGIIGHNDLRDAGYATSHYDPGPHFPWDYWLGRVRVYYDALTPWFQAG
jgi:hypothetical protein